MTKLTKLTLSIPDRVLKQAKAYAKKHETSISSIVTSLFQSLQSNGEPLNPDEKGKEAITTASVAGIISSAGKTKSDLISEGLSSKYKKR